MKQNQINNEILSRMNKSFELTALKKYCRENYTSSVKKFLTFHDGKIQSIETLELEHVKDFLSHMLNVKRLKIGTVNNYRSALKYLFEIVLKKEWCDKQIPFLSGYKTLPTVLSYTQVMSVIKSSETLMYNTLFLIIYSSGMRVDEALNLRISDIEPARMQINIRQSKNGSSRKAILSEKALQFLRDYFKNWWIKKFGKYDREDFLFCLVKKNVRVSYTSALKAFAKAVKTSGINSKPTIHSLRHSFAVYLLEKGVSIAVIKELLGHNSLKSTLIYTKLANYSVMGIKSPLDYEQE